MIYSPWATRGVDIGAGASVGLMPCVSGRATGPSYHCDCDPRAPLHACVRPAPQFCSAVTQSTTPLF